VPGCPAGTGSKLWATHAICSGPLIVSDVISDSYMPGAMEFIRTDVPLRVNSSRECFGEMRGGPCCGSLVETLHTSHGIPGFWGNSTR